MNSEKESTELSKELDNTTQQPKSISEFPKSAKSYTYLKRRLKEEELMNAGAINLLIDELERLETASADHKTMTEKFHATDKENGILQQKLSVSKSVEIVQSLSLSLGSLLLGASKSLWDMGYLGIIILTAGVALIVAAIVSKAMGYFK